MGRSKTAGAAQGGKQGPVKRGSWKLGHAPVLALFTLLALALSWPLLVRFTGWVPGIPQWAFDEFTFVWNIWYFKQAVVERLASPLHTQLIYYPLGIDLVLYTFNFFNALVALPLQLAGSLVVASNVTLVLSTALSGYGTYLLVRWLLTRGSPGADGGRQGLTPPLATDVASPLPSPLVEREGGGELASRGRGEASTLAALLAGILYAFASNRAIYMALGHYDMVTTQWIPFYALMLLRSLDGRLSPARRYRAGALAGLFFAFSGLAEMILAVFLAIFTLIVVAITLLGRKTEGGGRRGRTPPPATDVAIPSPLHRWRGEGIVSGTKGGRGEVPPISNFPPLTSLLTSLLLVGVTAFLVWSPVLLPILKQFLTADFSLKGWGEAIPLSTDLLGWFTPTVLHPLFGGDLVAELRRVQLKALSDAVPGFRDVNTVFLGWASLALALLGWLTHRRRVRIWSWTALVFGLFTLGPFLQIDGRYRFDLDGVETSFPLPYALLHYIPIVKANRAPNRNSVLLMLGLAVLAGYGAFWLLEKLEGRRRKLGVGGTSSPGSLAFGPRFSSVSLTILLALAILFEHLAVPLPLSDARAPQVYAQIAQDPRPVSVMHLPLGWRNSFGTFGPERTRLQYYQTVHRKPMLGGNISRAPDFKMDYFRRIPLFQALVEVQSKGQVDPDLVQAAKAQAEELVYLYNIGYVLLFPAIPQRFPYADTWQESWRLAWELLPLEQEPFWTGQGIRAYRTVQPPGVDRFQLRLGEPGTFPYRGEGWDQAETDVIYDRPAIWATARESCLFLPLRQVQANGTYRLRLQVHPFAYPGGPPQQVTATVNGQPLGDHALADTWQELTWDVPGSALENSLNRLCLDWEKLAVPRQVVPGDRSIGRTGVTLPVDADLKAFPDGGFIALFDEEGRQRDGSAGRRGVNVTVLDPESGAILAREGFDTAANAFESEKLARFLATIPEGRPVLVVSKGEAWAHLTPEAIQALNRLGADLSPEALQGRYFALVGVAGAAPGTALQAVDDREAFLRVSLNRDRRTLAGAVSQVSIGPAEE